jgi:hypothetical protein
MALANLSHPVQDSIPSKITHSHASVLLLQAFLAPPARPASPRPALDPRPGCWAPPGDRAPAPTIAPSDA